MNKEKHIYKLPDGWIWTTIGEIGIVQSGGTPSTRNKEFWGDEVSWITPADLSGYKEKYILKGNRSITKTGLDYSSAKLLPKGTILFSSRAPIGYTVITKNELATNQGFKNLIPTKSLNSEYVYYYFKTLKSKAEEVASGTTFLELSVKKFSQLPFPLAPPKEQERIVLKIESLFSELNQAEKGLQKAKQQLDVYRHALLKSAFEGKLTEIWRKQFSSPKFLPQDIVQMDLASRKNYWIRRKEIEFEGKGKHPKTLDWQKKYPIPFSLANEDFLMPKEWGITNWSQISNWITYGFTKVMQHEKSGIPIVTAKNVIHNKISFEQVHFASVEAFNSLSEKDVPMVGDILITKDGTLGRAAIVEDDMFCINQSVAVIWLRSTIMNKQFLLYYTQTPHVQTWIKNNAKGSTIKHLSVSDFPKLEIPIPTIEEQLKIVNELESQFTLIENLEKTIKKSLNDVKIFKQSLLKKAFEGKLVNQESGDESAIILLQKIKKEKDQYLKTQKEVDKLKPKKKKQLDKKKTVLEILKESKEPISTQELWANSIHEGDIESFYSEIKEIYSKLTEFKEDTQSLISLKK